MRVTNKSENNCGVCQLSTPKHHLTAPQTKILCTRGNGHTIFAEKKKEKKKPFLELSQKRSWLELRRAREKQKGDRCFSSVKLAAAELPPSSSLQPLTLRVSLFITSHQLERSQSTARTHWHAHTKTEWEDQKVKGRRREPNEHWRGSLKTSREGWGSEKGTNMLDWKKGKGLEKRHRRKSTYDANGGIHSTLSSQGHICQYKLCLGRKWKHKEAKTSEVQKVMAERTVTELLPANNVHFVTPGWCWWHKRSCFCI